MLVRIVYRKPSTGAFITIESEMVSEDKNYVYLECGKYLRKNIISAVYVSEPNNSPGEDLPDDA